MSQGSPARSSVVAGVVCRKNMTHRKMRRAHQYARVMLLAGALEYQRVENRLSSLDTLLDQEREYLRVAVARITNHQPHVLLVEKTVARYAQVRWNQSNTGAESITFIQQNWSIIDNGRAGCSTLLLRVTVPSTSHLLSLFAWKCS